MSEYLDTVIWIDRREAKVFQVSATEAVKEVLMHTSAQRLHHQANHEDGTPHAPDPQFFKTIVQTVRGTGGILIAGPGNSKFELKHYMDLHHQELAARISGLETLDEAADAGVLELARRFFRTRGHRHQIEPGYDARKNDTPTRR